MAPGSGPLRRALLARGARSSTASARAAVVGRVLGLYGASRVLALLVAHAAAMVQPGVGVLDVAMRWDGGWYVLTAMQGYPRQLPAGEGLTAATTLPFFPGFPLLIRGVAAVTPLDLAWAGVVASLLTGATATLVVWLVAHRLASEVVADRSAALFAFFPSAFAFSMPYSEGLFVTLAGLSLWLLLRRDWVLAGLLAAAATTTRANAIAIVAACAWAAAVALVRHRDPRALAAPLIAPLGVAGWWLFLWQHTGDPSIWLRAQDSGFGAHVDFGVDSARRMWRFVQAPVDDFNLFAAGTSVIFLLVAGALLLRWRPPFELVVFVAAVMAPVVLKNGMGSLWRYELTAFPLIIAVARSCREWTLLAVIGVSAGSMATLFFVASTSLRYTP